MQTHSSAVQASAEPAGSLPRVQSAAAALAERRLVGRVFEQCDAVIREACPLSSAPPEFLGALTANESGGRRDATRFEPGVYRHLQAVASGKSGAYGSLTAAALDAEAAKLLPSDAALHARHLTAAFAANHGAQLASLPDEALRELSTSWGYTQIMGYHMVGRAGKVRDLIDPPFHYRVALRLLSEFAAGYDLDPAREFSEMFCCWNTGRPNGKTFDPNYVENGLRRMRIYRQLQAGAAAGR
ncbi:MAG TPA: hypothetical protein VMW54_05265 [Terriglobia bacterium]|nr:hypothetical protein [Terriglobia bacterium]